MNASTDKSIPASAMRGSAPASRRTSACMPSHASSSPTTPPAAASTTPFGQQLPRESRPAGAECQPNGDLALSGGAAREQQVRDVDARDEQNERDRDRDHEQAISRGAHHLILQRDRAQSPSLRCRRCVAIGVRRAPTRGDGVEVGVRCCRSRTCGAAQHDGDDLVAARIAARRLERRRNPEVGALAQKLERRVGKADVGRHDADDRSRKSGDGHRAPDNRGIAAEASRPERVAEHDDSRRAGLAVVAAEAAADAWARPRARSNRFGAHDVRHHALRLPAVADERRRLRRRSPRRRRAT